MKKDIWSARIKNVHAHMKQAGIPYLLLTTPSPVTYVTGFLGSDSWALITPRQVTLLTDSRYTEQARTESPYCRIHERSGSLAEALALIISRSRSICGPLAVDKSVTLETLEHIKKNTKQRVRILSDFIATLRCQKDVMELQAIKKAVAITQKTLNRVKSLIRPGMTETALAGHIDFEIRKLGGTSAFETIVAFGPHASRPHHRPTSRKLRQKDTILMDFGAKVNGYCSDITRCFVRGCPSPLYLKAYEAVHAAQAAALARIRAGVRIVDVDAAARQVIQTYHFPVYGHGTGHGFGLDIHEAPYLKPAAPGALQANQVVTVEPGVYIPGVLGIRLEDDVLVTQTGYRLLTRRRPHSWELTP